MFLVLFLNKFVKTFVQNFFRHLYLDLINQPKKDPQTKAGGSF